MAIEKKEGFPNALSRLLTSCYLHVSARLCFLFGEHSSSSGGGKPLGRHKAPHSPNMPHSPRGTVGSIPPYKGDNSKGITAPERPRPDEDANDDTEIEI